MAHLFMGKLDSVRATPLDQSNSVESFPSRLLLRGIGLGKINANIDDVHLGAPPAADRRAVGDEMWTNLSTLLPSPLENASARAASGAGDFDDDGAAGGPLNWGVLALFLLIVATALGNVLVCLAVCWDRRLQNMTNYFLMSLAIADLLVALLVMPLGLIVELYGFFPMAPGVCVAWASMDVLMCTASIWHMCTMSMDRYFTLKYPMKYGRNKTTFMVATKITFVWVVSMAICSPLSIMGFVDYSKVYQDNQCAPAIPNFIIYGSVFAFYIPLFIMVVTYTLTRRILRNNQKLMKNLVEAQQAKKCRTINGNLPNNAYLSNGNANMQVPSPVGAGRPMSDISFSEKASVHDSSEDFLDRATGSRSASRKGSDDSAKSKCTVTVSEEPVSPDDNPRLVVAQSPNVKGKDTNIYQFRSGSPASTTHLTLNGSMSGLERQGRFSNKPTLSVSQPHLPSMGNYSHRQRKHCLLSPSTSHHSLNISRTSKSQLTVNHFESIQNFDSILSLNSMLSHNWGSEAWSDFDEPAILDRLSQIEAEMDECLHVDGPTETSESSPQPQLGLHSDSDVNSPRSLAGSTSLGIYESPPNTCPGTTPKPPRPVFCFPSSAPQSPVMDTINFSQQNGWLGGQPGSHGTPPVHHKQTCSRSHSACSSLYKTGYSSAQDTMRGPVALCDPIHVASREARSPWRPGSPVIRIEDTTLGDFDSISENGSINGNLCGTQNLQAGHCIPQKYTVQNDQNVVGTLNPNNILEYRGNKHSSTNNHSPLVFGDSSNQKANEHSCSSALDARGCVATRSPLTPIITTSPASSRSQSQHSNLSEGASNPGSPTSTQSGLITIELKPQGCYMYRVGDPCVGSPWKMRNGKGGGARTCEDVLNESVESLLQEDSGESNPWQLKAGGDQNGCACSQSTNHLCPHMASPNKSNRSSPSKQLLGSSQCPSLIETELVSQELERSTDETLSEPVSYSTTSTGRYHVPSLSIQWSAKSPNHHGIPWKTFLRSYTLRKNKHSGKYNVAANSSQFMSKRTATNEKKASKVLGIIFAVFVVLWTPFFLVNIITAICVPCLELITQPMMASLVWLGYMSSLANPIIYTMFNTSFRRAFYNILTCRLKRRTAGHNSHSTHTKRHRTNTAYFSTSDRHKSNHLLTRH